MKTASIAAACIRLLAGCSLALVAGAAFAHGGGHDSGNQGSHMSWHKDRHGGGSSDDADHRSHHAWRHKHHNHHHHKKSAGNGPGGLGLVHGSGSSHNPIVYHPPAVHPPINVPKSGPGGGGVNGPPDRHCVGYGPRRRCQLSAVKNELDQEYEAQVGLDRKSSKAAAHTKISSTAQT